jgi:hypothetical protein
MSSFKADDGLFVTAWEQESASSTSSMHEVALEPDDDAEYSALLELYRNYVTQGKLLFGSSFNQFGDFGTFACYVYKHMKL